MSYWHADKYVIRLNQQRSERYESHHSVSTAGIFSILETLPEYTVANNVLLTDDGVASQLYADIKQDGKVCWFLDPHDGFILQCQRHMIPRPIDYPCNFLPFSELPLFDLFVTGCYGHFRGYAYTQSAHFIPAFNLLEWAGRVTDQTCRVVLANPDQANLWHPNHKCLTQVQYVITPGVGAVPQSEYDSWEPVSDSTITV